MHADPNILLAIIKQIKDQDIDVIIPIGTSGCQTVISHIPNKRLFVRQLRLIIKIFLGYWC